MENYGQVSIEDKRNTISASVVCVRMLQYKTHTEVLRLQEIRGKVWCSFEIPSVSRV